MRRRGWGAISGHLGSSRLLSPPGKHAGEVGERIKVIRAEAELTDSQFDKEKAEERIAKLGGAIGRIKVE